VVDQIDDLNILNKYRKYLQKLLAFDFFRFILVSNFSIKDSEFAEKVDLSTFLVIEIPRLSRQKHQEMFLNLNAQKIKKLQNGAELVKVSIGNYYDIFINMNEYFYSVGSILDDEDRLSMELRRESLKNMPKTIEKYITNLHVKNITENFNHLLKKKIERNITENISPSQKLLLFAAFLACNSPSKLDNLLFKNVKKIKSARIKVKLNIILEKKYKEEQ
jgi:hypothetical protein